MKVFSFTLPMILSLAAQAHIQDIAYGGNGCPAGSAQIQINQEQEAASLSFDKFYVNQLRGQNQIGRVSCSLSIPVVVPEGYQVAIVTETLGFAAVKRKASVTVDQEIFRAGMRGQPQQLKFQTPINDHFEIRHPEMSSQPEMVWSSCGGSTNLRANLSLITRERAAASIDQFNLKLVWRQCR